MRTMSIAAGFAVLCAIATPVLAAMSVGAVVLLAVLFLYRESNAHPDPQAGRLLKLAGDYRDLLRGRSVRTFALTLAFTYGAMFCVIRRRSVVLPAPLRPMIPTLSPRLSSRSIPRSAQNSR